MAIGSVPAVLDGIVCATRQHFGDHGPLVAPFLLHLDDDSVLFVGPVALGDAHLQVVVVALAALLARAAIHALTNDGPIFASLQAK